MKIALVQPNLYIRYPQPPLGLLTIGTICQNAGHAVRLYDANARHYYHDDLLREVREAHVIGITAMSISYAEAKRLAFRIKTTYPDKFLLLGGVHATLFPDDVLDKTDFDAVVVGESENLIPLILNGQTVNALYKSEVETDMDDIPTLDYGLLSGQYRAMPPHGLHRPVMPMMTSRGCPFHCSFCSKAVFGNHYRTQGIERVIEEINTLVARYGMREISFYDDVFTLQKDRARDLSIAISNRVSWTCQTRVNLVDRQTLKAMKDGGCHAVAYGIESASPDILKSIAKDITVEQVEQAVRYSHEVGLRVIGYFMLGSPGETEETIKQTINWAVQLGIDYAQFSVTTPLPGSELYDQCDKSQLVSSYALTGNPGNGLCDLGLKTAVSQAYRHFYLRPAYVWQQFRHMIKSWPECRLVLDGFGMFLRGG